MRLIITVTAITLALAGCSVTGDTPDLVDTNELVDPGSGSAISVQGGSTTSTQGSGDDPTLADFLPGSASLRLYGDATDAEERFRELERSYQDKIAACMAEQGFEYIPYVPTRDQAGFVGPDSDEEWAELYGFSVATLILDDASVDLVAMEAASEAARAQDPNVAIVEALTSEERQEYNSALAGLGYGEGPGAPLPEGELDASAYSDEPPGESSSVPLEDAGCSIMAEYETYNVGASTAFYEQFGSMIEDMHRDVEADPRISEMEERWSRCMAEQGYDVQQLSDVREFLLRRLEEVGAITDLTVGASGEVDGYMSVRLEPGSSVEMAVKEIAAEEIAMAKISLACSGDRDDMYDEVNSDLEQRFIQEHRAELEQFKSDHS